jgi:hypothetical protein
VLKQRQVRGIAQIITWVTIVIIQTKALHFLQETSTPESSPYNRHPARWHILRPTALTS